MDHFQIPPADPHIVDRLAEPLSKAVGGRTATPMAEALDLHTVGDLLRHYPRRYLEPTELTDFEDLPVDEIVTLVAEVLTANARRMASRRGSLLDVVVTDGRGRLHLTFFRTVPYHQKRLTPGRRVLLTGKVSSYRGQRQLAHPEYELLEEDVEEDGVAAARELASMPIPVYPASAKVPSAVIRRTVRTVLDTLGEVPDPLPDAVRERHRLVDLRQAFELVHRPTDMRDQQVARRRLRWEEAFVLQAALLRRRAITAALHATPRAATAGGLLDAFDERIPFTLTAGQESVGGEIAADLAGTHPMHRLLQGEVGSGKTLVALRAMLTVVDAGGQAALLAPTEVLAAQHHRSITAMLGDLAQAGFLGGDDRGTQVALLTGSLGAAARKRALLSAASGEAGIVVGTHALLQEKVQFADLGLVVVDEQHRFGVEQRDALRAKGRSVPHLLVMTATPIPRTVAMTVFGDLEVSSLTELPAGRSPIATHVVPVPDRPEWLERAWVRLREEVDAGHQGYVVCPRIGDDAAGPARGGSDDSDWVEGDAPPPEEGEERRPARAVVETLAQLRETRALEGLTIEALHGRLPAEERDDVMRRFAAGEIHVLVATTVVEVGVDVPNATAMVVLDADRFGVSQLHQLRGRVGRGSAPGLCLLVTDLADGPSRERLDAVAATLDGFELARVDLEQRREGDVLGAAQSGGRSSLRLLRVLRDEDLIGEAREEAAAVVSADPELAKEPALLAALEAWLDPEREAYLDRG
jgi:ATP-dependent DNA helicase RecG